MKIALAAVIALAIKLVLIFTTYGTNDAYTTFVYGPYLIQAAGPLNAYKVNPDFIFPAFFINHMAFLVWLANLTGQPVPILIKLAASLADLGSLLLLAKAFPQRLASLSLFTLAPAAIMISGFHTNTDSHLMFFLVLAVYQLHTRSNTVAAALAFAMALNFKVWPIVLIPLFLFYLDTNRKRLTFVLLTASVFIISGLPYYLEDPIFYAQRILGYRSLAERWGITFLLPRLALPTISKFYELYGAFITLAICTGTSFWMCRRPNPPSLFRMTGIIALIFLALTPGFGVQYLAWILPWTVEFPLIPVAVFHLTSGLMLFFYYTHYAGGLPWHLADTINVAYSPHLDHFFTLCWVAIMLLLVTSITNKYITTTASLLALTVLTLGITKVRTIPPTPPTKQYVTNRADAYMLTKIADWLRDLNKIPESIRASRQAAESKSK